MSNKLQPTNNKQQKQTYINQNNKQQQQTYMDQTKQN